MGKSIWDQTGMQTVEDWLRSNAAVVPNDITKLASGVSPDGRAIVGGLTDFTGFLANGPSPINAQSVPMAQVSGLVALALLVLGFGQHFTSKNAPRALR